MIIVALLNGFRSGRVLVCIGPEWPECFHPPERMSRIIMSLRCNERAVKCSLSSISIFHFCFWNVFFLYVVGQHTNLSAGTISKIIQLNVLMNEKMLNCSFLTKCIRNHHFVVCARRYMYCTSAYRAAFSRDQSQWRY